MKKLIKFIIGIISAIILIAIILTIIIGILVFDNSNRGEKTSNTTNDSISELNYNALETTKDNKLSYTVDVITLNSLLGSLSNSINLNPVEITNMYTTYNNLDDEDLENDTITLYIPMKFFLYETCLISTMNIIEDDSSFTLRISDADLGKVNSNFFLVKGILDKSFNPQSVENELRKQEIETKCEFKDGVFSINIEKNELLNTIIKYLDDNILYKTIIDVIKENPDLYNISFSGKEKGFVINLAQLSSTISNDKSFEKNSNPNEIIKKAEKLLENKIIDKTQTPYVVDYLVRGYYNLDSESKEIISKIDMSSIGINNVKTYNGIIKRNDVNLVNVIAQSLIGFSPLTNQSVNVDLSDDDINAIIDDQEIIGKTFSFIKDNKINYITIGSIYITSSYHKLLLTLIIDLNGKEIKMDFTLDASNIENGYVIKGTLTKAEIGSISLNNNEQIMLLEYLEQNINSNLLKIDSKAKTLSLDFDSYFNDSSLILSTIAKNHLTKQIEVLDNKVQVRLKISIL